jgi:hypothetical protein
VLIWFGSVVSLMSWSHLTTSIVSFLGAVLFLRPVACIQLVHSRSSLILAETSWSGAPFLFDSSSHAIFFNDFWMNYFDP